jgi:hypothetical protein
VAFVLRDTLAFLCQASLKAKARDAFKVFLTGKDIEFRTRSG